MEKNLVLLGVTGGIAAYKGAELVSLLVKQDLAVQVIMTKKAQEFITPLTFSALSGNPVWLDEFDFQQRLPVPHVTLAEQADLLVIAPATANTIAKLARGIGDNLLSALALAYNKKMLVAPAMNTNMYQHLAVQENLRILQERGVEIIQPEAGRLACGAVGPGRLASVAEIAARIQFHLYQPKEWVGKKVMVTAGGTRENIDPVRYIGNRSSGKMGFALAKAAWLRGAETVLISGPTELEPPQGILYRQVESAGEMRQAVLEHYPETDVVIKAAAVADYRSDQMSLHKIKKDSEYSTLKLVRTPDILQELGEKKTGQILVGFAAETENLLTHARQKLTKKKLDLIVANDHIGSQVSKGSGSHGHRIGNVMEFQISENLFPLTLDVFNNLWSQATVKLEPHFVHAHLPL
jgi:phosphopantothenoylcysteine decarboxylase/phosphopantothenate--cysteine ligase